MLSDSEMRQLSSPVSLTIRVGRIVLVLSAIGAMIGILSAIFMKDAYSSVIFALIFYAMSFSMFTASFVGLTRKKKWGVSFGIVSFTMAAAYSAYQI